MQLQIQLLKICIRLQLNTNTNVIEPKSDIVTFLLHNYYSIGSDEADTKLQLQWYHFTGVLLFIYASSYHQYKRHSILANIRTGCDGNTYGLPKGGWFELVTSPHYFAEILIYTGIAMVQGLKNVWTIAPVISTSLLLLIGAKLTHEWYTETYREECSKRCALIPYIY